MSEAEVSGHNLLVRTLEVEIPQRLLVNRFFINAELLIAWIITGALIEHEMHLNVLKIIQKKTYKFNKNILSVATHQFDTTVLFNKICRIKLLIITTICCDMPYQVNANWR